MKNNYKAIKISYVHITGIPIPKPSNIIYETADEN